MKLRGTLKSPVSFMALNQMEVQLRDREGGERGKINGGAEGTEGVGVKGRGSRGRGAALPNVPPLCQSNGRHNNGL